MQTVARKLQASCHSTSRCADSRAVLRSRHSIIPRRRRSDSMAYRSSCARCSPAHPLLALLVRSLSTRRYAASTRSRARSRSTRVYWRGSGRVRFFRGDERLLNARWISPRLTPVNFFVTSPSLRTPRSGSDRGNAFDQQEAAGCFQR